MNHQHPSTQAIISRIISNDLFANDQVSRPVEFVNPTKQCAVQDLLLLFPLCDLARGCDSQKKEPKVMKGDYGIQLEDTLFVACHFDNII